MTKKVLKEQQQETREIVKQIFNLALALNPNRTMPAITGEKPTVFVDFSGHVSKVDVRIYHYGWPSSDDCDDEMTTYTIWLGDDYFTQWTDDYFTQWTDDYEPYPEEKECKQLSEAKIALAELRKIAEEWGVDYV